MTLFIFEIVGNPTCFSASDGQKVYDRLAAVLKDNRTVILSFNNIRMLTPTFLNAAIGQLYSTFSREKIRSLLAVTDIKPTDIALLKRVVDTAKQFFKE